LVGDPAQRIAEDVLRLLRYYRFEARFGTGQGDAAARAACREAAPLLPTLSAERIAHELVRLLGVADPVPALRMMREDGVLAAILPEATRLDRLENLIEFEASPDPLLRLAALIDADAPGAIALAERLRLSNAQRDRLAGLALPWPVDLEADARGQRRAIYELGRDPYRDLVLLLAAEGRVAPDRRRELLDLAAQWSPPEFPLSGRDVTALGIPPGPHVGRLLDQVRLWWEEGDFAADRAACLEQLSRLANAESSNQQ
jgi:poly(A) polymerase